MRCRLPLPGSPPTLVYCLRLQFLHTYQFWVTRVPAVGSHLPATTHTGSLQLLLPVLRFVPWLRVFCHNAATAGLPRFLRLRYYLPCLPPRTAPGLPISHGSPPCARGSPARLPRCCQRLLVLLGSATGYYARTRYRHNAAMPVPAYQPHQHALLLRLPCPVLPPAWFVQFCLRALRFWILPLRVRYLLVLVLVLALPGLPASATVLPVPPPQFGLVLTFWILDSHTAATTCRIPHLDCLRFCPARGCLPHTFTTPAVPSLPRFCRSVPHGFHGSRGCAWILGFCLVARTYWLPHHHCTHRHAHAHAVLYLPRFYATCGSGSLLRAAGSAAACAPSACASRLCGLVLPLPGSYRPFTATSSGLRFSGFSPLCHTHLRSAHGFWFRFTRSSVLVAGTCCCLLRAGFLDSLQRLR